MKVIFEYDELTGLISDVNGLSVYMLGMKGFTVDKQARVLELIKQGVTPDEIIKLKNNGLL